MTVLLRNTQSHPTSVPHEVRDVYGSPFTLRPFGESGDTREVPDHCVDHPKLEKCLRLGWLIIVRPAESPEPSVTAAIIPPSIPDPEPLGTSLPAIDGFLSYGLTRAAAELLWAESCIVDVFTAAHVPVDVARHVLRALIAGLTSRDVLRELRRIDEPETSTETVIPADVSGSSPPPSPTPPSSNPVPIVVEDLSGASRPSRRPL